MLCFWDGCNCMNWCCTCADAYIFTLKTRTAHSFESNVQNYHPPKSFHLIFSSSKLSRKAREGGLGREGWVGREGRQRERACTLGSLVASFVAEGSGSLAAAPNTERVPCLLSGTRCPPSSAVLSSSSCTSTCHKHKQL